MASNEPDMDHQHDMETTAPDIMEERDMREEFDSMHRRLDALEKTVEDLPRRIWSALDARVQPNPAGVGVTHVLDLAIKALTDAILISAAPERYQRRKIRATASRMATYETNDMAKKTKVRVKRSTLDHPDSSPSTLLLLSNGGRPPAQQASPITIPNTRRHPKTEIPPEMPKFTWSDGSKQFAPQGWLLPTTSSRTMWELWFAGDNTVGPFQHLTAKDLEDATSKVNLSCARGVMVTLIQIALDQNLVASPEAISLMSSTERAQLFDQVFPRLIQNEPADVVEKAPTYTYTNAYKRLIKGKRKAQRSAGFENVGYKSPTGTNPIGGPSPDWEFPATNCKTMWYFWFKGDEANGIGPFRHFRPRDIDKEVTDGPARRQFSRARGVMEKLIDIAVTNGFANSVDDLDTMSTAELEAVFDQAFDVLMHDSPEGSLVGDGPGQLRSEKMSGYSYGTVYSAMAQRKRKRSVEGEVDDGQYEL
ncbi:unnamed protein product [Aphanomyces euteiches]|uniref:Uncharacterized protein n=1 Tax=Aphanomyces euteiches TaxID=100861 RepID=A0A6G0X025_9STRA|nr:hypothetical protein Ae201684_009955 [Aphanomyces euteiches]KAH9095899.1 hypothetical protein Ae201684P_010109 [Aphanomyces euteiches]KAH9139703.1 hypothetical protein AeRB84_016048 [Aphanomyces euteiches]